jgi:hypothetical protein
MVFVGSLVFLLCSPQDSLDKQVSLLLDRIRAEEIEAREAALKEMIALGEPAIDAIEKAAAACPDAETAARLKSTVAQIRRNAMIVKVAPPAKRVTVSASGVPLRDFLKDVCAQAGVEYFCDGAVADKPVTIEGRNEPLLQVIDRACAARGDIAVSLAEGKLKFVSGTSAGEASAYAQGYRVRVRRRVVTETAEAGTVKTSVVLYFDLDAQPDHKVRGATLSLPRTAAIPGGDIQIRGMDTNPRMAGWFGGGGSAIVVDGVAVTVEGVDSLDRICLIKELPAGLKSLTSLKVGARFRYSVGMKQISVNMTMRGSDRFPDVPFNIQYAGPRQIYFIAIDQSRGLALEDFIDIETMVLVGKDGRENKLSSVAGGMKGRHYLFQTEREIQAGDSPQLKVQTIDALDREVEFELKDIKLRD